MNENIELDLVVDKVTETNGEERSFTVALKGEKAVLIEGVPGFERIDIVKAKVTLTCGMNETLEQLGIAQYMNNKVVVLRDRDTSLSSYAAKEQKLAV